ncbi:hypothetical protein [Propioniciclava tarda]|nr:hypothetical protein [Propioniciclava tarda]
MSRHPADFNVDSLNRTGAVNCSTSTCPFGNNQLRDVSEHSDNTSTR